VGFEPRKLSAADLRLRSRGHWDHPEDLTATEFTKPCWCCQPRQVVEGQVNFCLENHRCSPYEFRDEENRNSSQNVSSLAFQRRETAPSSRKLPFKFFFLNMLYCLRMCRENDRRATKHLRIFGFEAKIRSRRLPDTWENALPLEPTCQDLNTCSQIYIQMNNIVKISFLTWSHWVCTR
jgi:hypothetical protein